MMTHENMKTIMFEEGRRQALALQERVPTLNGTELNAEHNLLPEFDHAKKVMNMIDRPIGFACKSPAGRVVKLVQSYNSEIFSEDPEQLPAQWGFVWSKDPANALPFIALSTSPYMIDECCTENEVVYASTMDNNTWAPSEYPQGWRVVEV